MAVDFVLENCKIARPDGILEASIAINNGRIQKIALSDAMPKADKTIDMSKKIVLPGAIDPHVHFRDPGFTEKEDFETGSLSALFGGVTTILDMPNTKPFTGTSEEFEKKKTLAEKKSYIDFSLYFGAMDGNIWEMRKVNPIGYKFYLDHPDIVGYSGLKAAASSLENKIFAVHAEDPDIMHDNLKKNSAADPKSHGKIRTAEAEMESVKAILNIEMGSNNLYFCHLSTPSSVKAVHEAGHFAELATPHLFLSRENSAELGNFARTNPSLKSEEDRLGLWKVLSLVSTLATDHAPHLISEKESASPPSGMPGVETFLPLMIDSVNKGLLDWTDVARLCSAGASNIFGLVNKGIIEEGKDADLVIIDRKKVWEIKASKLHSKCAWTPFEGRKLKGKIDSVFRGGKLAIDKGKLLAKPGQGKYIAPER